MKKMEITPSLLLMTDDIEDINDCILASTIQKEIYEKKSLYIQVQFNISAIPEQNFRHFFRFDKIDILQLWECLALPARFETEDRHIISGVNGLCLVLQRFTYPNRLKDLQNDFGLQYSSLSKLLKHVINFLYEKWGRLLRDLKENKWFTQDCMHDLATVIYNKGAPLKKCIGFIDGTARLISRPTMLQKEVYSGHKRSHCLKFQAITLPNGIMVHLSGPYPGRRHDAFLLKDSKILQQLRIYCGEYYLYGDEGYPLREQLIRPYSSTNLSNQQTFNLHMSQVRQCVEWSFGKVVQQFAFVDFKKNQKLFLQPVGKYYVVAVLLTNAHTCLYGSNTNAYFNVNSPDLNEYFS